MALRKIRGRKVWSNRCTQCTRCAAWDSCSGFVCSEEEVLELEFDDLVKYYLGPKMAKASGPIEHTRTKCVQISEVFRNIIYPPGLLFFIFF
jgi:hypothetical protein